MKPPTVKPTARERDSILTRTPHGDPPSISRTRSGRALATLVMAMALLARTAGAAEAQSHDDRPRLDADAVSSGGEASKQTGSANLSDRGAGLVTSRFGTYVLDGEWLLEPSFEYSRNKDREYDPASFGFPTTTETFEGRYEEGKARLFSAYGLSDRVAIEFEAQAIRASLEKEDGDLSGMPETTDESGLGEVRSRLDWRWCAERGHRPELFSYGEVVFPHDKGKPLTGTSDWVFNAGLGAIHGFSWGTMTFRVGLEYDTSSESAVDFHEYALEYLKRFSPAVTLYAGYVVFEGDEANLVTELQWSPEPRVVVKMTSQLGVVSSVLSTSTSSTDWSLGAGVLFRFPEQ